MPWSGTSLDLLHCNSTCNYPANYFCTNQFCYWLVIDLMFTCENKAGISFNSSLSLPQDQFIKNGKCNYDGWPHSFTKYICPLTVFTLSFPSFSFLSLFLPLSLRRYEISPVCTDLQGQILKCYKENAGKTLLCSNIASLYMQCVNRAKQVKIGVCFYVSAW